MNFHNVFQIDHFGSFLNKIELYEDSFDYILNSLQYSLSNAESMKCLTEEENEKETRFARCWCKILNELIHSKSRRISPYTTFFQSAINSFHNLHRISTKTTICLSILLWKNLKVKCENGNLLKMKMSKLLPEILETMIEQVKNNQSVYLTDLKEKLMKKSLTNYDFIGNKDYFKKLLNGICRNQAKITELTLNMLIQFQNRFFDHKNVSIMVSCSNNNGFGSASHDFNYEIAPGFIDSLSVI